jgi:N-acetylglucosaminyl-diphospho-decaprenol L-rhamnosyltransferase
MRTSKSVIFSLVSHGQLPMINDFLKDFRTHAFDNVRILLTINIPEDESSLNGFADLPISIIRNKVPKGFGANHNAAFAQNSGDIFVIVNPDIRLENFRLDFLTTVFDAPEVGACAPVVRSSSGSIEDSARRFPTIASLFRRAISGRRGADYTWSNFPISVEWTAGMFVAYRPAAFTEVGGFDERFFMYYEDADICRRLAKHRWSTVLQPRTSVIHDAQRASRHSRQHMKWHLQSVFRFLFLPMK